ncbi:MAG: lytic transglycosylase domain-containing protein [Calothrix sp. SM1_5_4]|nr:lytic transglycosylase domain-containing protein [Calothrix sp. SM1_5_4]
MAKAVVGESSSSPTKGLCVSENRNDPKVMKYCEIIRKVLMQDQTSCAYKQLQEILRKPIKADSFCGNYNNTDKTAFYYNVIAKIIDTESGGNPETKGDVGKMRNGGSSHGYMQITPGDPYEDCKNITEENVTDPELNIRCGACAALTNVNKHGVLAEDQKGVAAYFGPWRSGRKEKRDIQKSLQEYCIAHPTGTGLDYGVSSGGTGYGSGAEALK